MNLNLKKLLLKQRRILNDSEDSKKETVDDSLSLKLVDEISELSKPKFCYNFFCFLGYLPIE